LPDAFAFVLWLVIAWFARWTATDLVWSLWLSSFVIGYALILWTVFRPAEQLASGIWRMRPRADLERKASGEMSPLGQESVIGIGALVILGFYTVAFAFANDVVSNFLVMYFPLDGNQFRTWPSSMSFYAEIAHRYWYFLPSAFLTARGAFLKNPLPELADPRSKTRWIEKVDSVEARGVDDGMTLTELNTPTTGLREAFRGVYRMLVLMIVFMICDLVHLANFPLYVVVYTCFFFPWRLVSRDASPATVTGTAPVV
jgi:hypothetical protein